MHVLSAKEIVELWDLSAEQRVSERVLTLLAHGYPEKSREAFSHMPLGRRDAYLLRLHRINFGAALPCFATCPACGSPLQFDLLLDELCRRGPAPGESDDNRELAFRLADYHIGFRLLDSCDLRAVEELASGQPERAAQLLAQRCIRFATCAGQAVPSETLPAEVIEELSRQLLAGDPLSEISLDLRCPDCQHSWALVLDSAAFFSRELHLRAQRLLAEVHALAQAYGWSESVVLSLSPRKRQAYLQLVRT